MIRKGLLIEEERRHLWHELVHAVRGDQACHVDDRAERSVDRYAATWAMPLRSLEWAFAEAIDETEAADLLKLPIEWVRFRLDVAHPAEKVFVTRAHMKRRFEEDQ